MSIPFEHHPIAGLIFTAFHAVAGCLVALKNNAIITFLFPFLHIHQPPIIAELLQDGAWSVAILTGLFTCYGIYKTHHGKKKGT